MTTFGAMFKKRKIDFLVIGVQKSGTTSLYEYLTAHLLIDSAKKKEVHYFDFNYDEGVNWYHKRFLWKRNHLQGEATPHYLFDANCAARAFKYNPNLKLITILRNPIDRAFSHYKMNVNRGAENLSFLDALNKEDERILETKKLEYGSSKAVYSYKSRGLYAKQLNGWLEHFPKNQLMVLDYERFFKNPWDEIQKVYRFLGLPDYHGCLKDFTSNKNVGNMSIPEDAKNQLRQYFAEPNRTLAQQYGINFEE
ncbi:sulfotransferase domain-containing protein [Owenweeksia hongkongensis]|uniref:sulfotransferase domain-containing protein n=1 Tax=Owenweeksia hongkongensis TaxID=253245 RepID=UPI003A95CA13